MRPRDAAAWLHAGRIAAAFISTDTALEAGAADYPSIPLGFSSSDLVIACRDDSGFETPADLAGKTIATHLPKTTRQWLADRSIDASVVGHGWFARRCLRARSCRRDRGPPPDRQQLGAQQSAHARSHGEMPGDPGVEPRCRSRHRMDDRTNSGSSRRPQGAVPDLPSTYRPGRQPGSGLEGLESPTVLPLDGHEDLVAVHVVVKTSEMWSHLADLRTLGASGVVALPVHALMP